MKFNGIVILLLVFLAGLWLRVHGIGAQPPTGDDLSVAISAKNYLESGHLGPTMWNHPNLRNVLVYASMHLLGGGVVGLKLWSLAFGALAVLLTGLVARELTGDDRAGALAALLMAVDSLHIDFSRQAVHEVYMACFSLAAIYFSLRFRHRENPWYLVLAGVSFGLGIASKWYVLFPLAVTGIFLLLDGTRLRGLLRGERPGRAVLLAATLLLLPATVYLLTFLPWFLRGYGIVDWLMLQKAMYIETKHHLGYNPYGYEVDYRPLLWFVKPVAFGDFAMGKDGPVVLLGITNPLSWLLTLPAMVWILRTWAMTRDGRLAYLFALFAGSYLPLALSQRPIWAHTAFAVIPFAFIGTARFLVHLLDRGDTPRRMLYAYLALLVLVSIPLYLLATGKGHDISLLQPILEMYRPSHER